MEEKPQQKTIQVEAVQKVVAPIDSKDAKQKIWLIISLVILLIASLGTTIYLAYQNYQLKKQIAQIQILSKPTPIPSQFTAISDKDEFFPDVKAEFQKIKEKYNGEVLETNILGIWWISSDNLNIINDNSYGIEFYVFDCAGDTGSKSNFKEIIQLIGPKINEIMKQNGFNTNQKNSSDSIEDSHFYDYIQAYENEAIKCVFEANPDCVNSAYAFSLGCTENFDRNYQQQSQYLKDLEIDNAIIRVKEEVGDFVKLNVNFRRTGYFTIAKLIDGKWNGIYSGQDWPGCEIVEKYEIPKEIISDCYSGEQ